MKSAQLAFLSSDGGLPLQPPVSAMKQHTQSRRIYRDKVTTSCCPHLRQQSLHNFVDITIKPDL